MIAEPENTNGEPDNPGGRGEGAEDVYLTPVQENKIVASMLNRKNRWHLKEGHKRCAVRMTARNMKNDDGRISNGAVSNLIKMEAQNQADEHKAQPDLVDISVHATILENPDFYGNADTITEALTASDADSGGPEPVQADDLRPPLGKNRNGTSGDN